MSAIRSLVARWVVASGVVAWLLMAGTASLSAHPTATSFVVITASETINVAITTEAESLLMKLEALGGGARPAPGSMARSVDERIRELAPVLIGQVELRVNDWPVTLTVTKVEPVKSRPEQVLLTLSGTAPSMAGTLRWRTSLFFGSYPVTVRSGSIDPGTIPAEEYEWLSGSELSQPYSMATLTPASTGWSHAGRLIAIGFSHIVPSGLDHVLFVLGLFLLAANARTLLLQISAFTVAHSCTLALAMGGWISAPARIVEPLIAVSIAYVAIENLMTTSLSRWRLAVVFVFGLLHGLGFASALADLGLSHAHFASTLIGFNVGVELGQIAVVLAATLLVRWLPLSPEGYRRLLVRPASALIASAGVVWAVQRVFF
jgi:hypothetical protein